MDESVVLDVHANAKRNVYEDGESIKIEIHQTQSTLSEVSNLSHESNNHSEKPIESVDTDSNNKMVDQNKDIVKSQQKPQTSNITCRFFKVSGTCESGDYCKYLHVLNPLVQQEGESNNYEANICDEKTVDELEINSPISRLCRYFVTQRGCRDGDTCPYKHYRAVSDAGDVCIQEVDSCTKVTIKEEDLERECLDSGVTKEKGLCINDNKHACDESSEVDKSKKDQSNARVDRAVKTKSTRMCRYYISKEGCKESDCRFKHGDNIEDKQVNKNIEQSSKIDLKNDLKSKKSEIVCRNTRSSKGCRKKDCPYLHPELDTKINTNKKKESENKDQQIEQRKNSSHSDSVVKKSKADNLCRLYNTERGCRSRSCPYIHAKEKEKNKAEVPETKQSSISNTASKNDRTYETKPKEENRQVSKQDEELVCKFFMSRHGCYSKNCQFLHPKKEHSSSKVRRDRDEHSENTFKEKPDSKKENVVKIHKDVSVNKNVLKENYQKNDCEKKTCRYYQNSRGCANGTRCPFLHVDKPKGINYEITKQKTTTKTAKDTEFTQLEKRFRSKFTLLQSDPSRIYIVKLSPTDPDWAFIIEEFDIQVEFPEEYPIKMFNLKLVKNEKYPPGFNEYFDESLSTWVEKRAGTRDEYDLAFRPFVKWFDRNLKDLFIRAATLVKLQRDAEKDGITFVPHGNILTQKVNNTETEEELQEESELTVADANDMIAMHDGTLTNGQDSNDTGLSEKVKKGTEMKFSNLMMSENVGTLKLRSVALTIQCDRCRSRMDINLQDKKSVSVGCKKCNLLQSVAYYSELIHCFSPVVGYLHIEGSKAFDLILLDSVIIANCMNCYKDNIFKGMAYGSKSTYFCHSCHEKIEVSIQATKLSQIGPSVGVSGKKKEEVVKKKSVKDPSIKDGEPLPDDGTCKHYKKSFRWLRFPCCGKAYPCDVCHEEKQENDHEIKFATRMICGFCSKEQPFFKDGSCIRCNSNMTRSKSSHWEGGKGCRNRTTMAKDDRRKTAGIGKTISRKKADQEKSKK